MADNIAHHIFNVAKKYQLNPQLVAAIIHQESSGRVSAFRYEPGFKRKYLDGKNFRQLGGIMPKDADPTTEMHLRSSSLGLMQVMGQVARERGYGGHLDELLHRPDLAIEYGARHFKILLDKKGDAHSALLAYNGGGDPNYPDKIFGHMDTGAHQYLFVQ